MARKLRVHFPGAIYHVTLRGVGRSDLFLDDRDRERFLQRLAQGVEFDEVRLYMYCLMTNHVHLLLETPRANLSQIMHRLQTGYTVFFNLRHQRSGHLTQGRYDAKLVEGDEYLLSISRYLHQNPVCIRRIKGLPHKDRVQALRAYRWSSYRGYVGLCKEYEWVDYEPVRSMMAGPKGKKKQAYRKFVESGLAETDKEFMTMLKASPLSVGSEEFREKVRDLHIGLTLKSARQEDVALRRMQAALNPEEVVERICEELGVRRADLLRRRRGCWRRAMAAKLLCKHAGLSQRDVAVMLGLKTGAAVSQQLKRLGKAVEESRKARTQLESLDATLTQEDH